MNNKVCISVTANPPSPIEAFTSEVFASITEAVKELNLQQPLITKCCKGERRSTGGYCWEYVID